MLRPVSGSYAYGGKDSCASQRLWGGNPTSTSTSRDTEIGGSHMSQKNSTARAVGAAIGGAAIAAFVGMGTAHATPVEDTFFDSPGVATAGVVGTPNDAYNILFGAMGTAAGE